MNSKLALVSTENTALDAKQNELLGDTRKLAIEAIDRIMMGCPTKIEHKSRLIFKNIAKEADISSTVLHREFRDIMSCVEVVKRKSTSHRTTVHAIDARKRCLDAIERIVNKATYIISNLTKLNTVNVAKEAGIDNSYIYQTLPDALKEIAKQQTETEVFGNQQTNAKLVVALNRLVESGQKVTVKDVCREAEMNKSFDVAVRKSYPDVHNATLNVIVEQKEEARLDERIALLDALERLSVVSWIPDSSINFFTLR
ncbi:hypothetical protein [Candidatus Enterovibrio altilux]|uniref:hypothetical protein n=1 Tax=Candidatus Enterovibrio altilux TaxID=1927128 RepID=UPI00123810F8|nr:hypothetical protein [Candidatus Enterovibrio luxaltus]